ncbi:hypothetical protein B0H67DRAFT_558890 [Lasiosphaeris hirsuta]|uniref:C2H2-type domain-containing protein n=1 Tax=Lasiosphaeris hirsuta TaxID=260670 RepID=A0AA40E9W1_9PEZI|nr:hypothetical protein B0H67DRAFT_558890 [Lasiosphaeris hirsuta]
MVCPKRQSQILCTPLAEFHTIPLVDFAAPPGPSGDTAALATFRLDALDAPLNPTTMVDPTLLAQGAELANSIGDLGGPAGGCPGAAGSDRDFDSLIYQNAGSDLASGPPFPYIGGGLPVIGFDPWANQSDWAFGQPNIGGPSGLRPIVPALGPVPVPLPAPPVAGPRHVCPIPGCTRSYKRRADLDRHMRKHDANAPRYPCPSPDCSRKGGNGFVRKDKLMEHRRRLGH